MTRYVVVTGTDTDVGKTFVTEALARLWSRDRKVVAVKPFESGAVGEGDGERLARATGQSAPTHALIRLVAPLAPAIAADREGVVIDFDDVVARIRALGAGADVVLVEAAGGVLSPLTWDHDALDLARALDAALVLVAADRLGTISATHAAVHVMHDRGLPPAAIVLGAPAAPDASTGTNADALRRRLAGPVRGRVIALPRTGLAEATELLGPLTRWLDLGP